MNRLTRINPSIPVVAILLALTAALRLQNLSGSPIRLDDEGTYVAQAFAVTQWGELAHYTYWYDHPPGGWLQIALWMMLTGPGFGANAVTGSRYLMVIVAVTTAGLLWLLARRIGLSRWAAAAALTIMAVSPLAISLSRSVYLDNLAVAWLLAALVAISSPRHRLSAMFGAAICFGMSVLTKETMLLFVPMVAWLVWIKTAPATRRYALAVFAAVTGLVIGTYVLMAIVRGELLPGPGHVSLWDGIKFQLWQREAGGALGDPQSLKRHTIDEWLRLDPVVPLMAAPIALGGLLVDRLRPYAFGLLTLVLMVVRPGYLPVPFVIAAIPLLALLCAGIGEQCVARSRGFARELSAHSHLTRSAAVTAAVFAGALVLTLWWPGYRTTLLTADDAPMSQAQQWVSDNVPKDDRLIVDDAIWVDLVRDGRERQNVVWSYKLDTDQQVQSWAPHGWADYEWVVSTPSMRANMTEHGVLNDAISHARPVATFGSSGNQVDILRVDADSPPSGRVPPSVPAFGVQVAARLDGTSNPEAVAALQSGAVDQRVVAALAVLSAVQPVALQSISSTAAEDVAGTPAREFAITGPADRLSAYAVFLRDQKLPFKPDAVELTDAGLTVRFPAHGQEVGLGTNPAPVATGTAAVRVVDTRLDTSPDRLEFVRLDGGCGGSAPTHAPDYRSMAAGSYVVATVSDHGGMPVMRQAFTLKPGSTYTLALFSGAKPNEVAAQLAPDGPPAPGATVRLMQAAHATGTVKLSMNAPGGAPTVLADNASYGLITGYGSQPPGPSDAVISADGREWHRPVDLADGAPATLLVTDGADGPALEQLPDGAAAPAPLDPPALTIPPDTLKSDKARVVQPPTQSTREQAIPAALILVIAVVSVVVLLKRRRR
ncbi:glycosyltransferase family 39 protein [Mycolicibacterium sp. P1-5]|uniref:ArnT family glycosyltransferase n=1 Tax=Mycolicibacterium sp. P1-5 TaxID=2024617 RepID=UPI0011F056CB|nr:glycosyltransferase family 39 protein [Mycolicibacterium sp. P1-5]KAA0108950.1 glycosyl transferase [Mycolicibacterium sp. P1-5]